MFEYRIVKRKCNNPKFVVSICCQGQPFDYQYSSLLGAVIGYVFSYLAKKKYGTMNFTLTLKEVRE